MKENMIVIRPLDLESAILEGRTALCLLAPGDHELPGLLIYLAKSHRSQYKISENTQDLALALTYGHAAVSAASYDCLVLAAYQQDLAISYTDSYYVSGDTDDLLLACKYDRAAVLGTPLGHSELPIRMRSLSVSYSDCFDQLGNVDDMEAALKLDLATVDSTPSEHPNYLSSLQNLAISYKDRYHRLGHLEDLEAALAHNQAAVDAAYTGHPEIPSLHHSLAVSYNILYRRLGNLEYLDAALKYDQAAVDGTPVGDPNLPYLQRGLAASYSDHYKRLGDISDLEAAINLSQTAANSIPPGHPQFPGFQYALAVHYSDRYKRLGNLSDLETSLDYKKSVVDASSPYLLDLPTYQHSLGVSYLDKYDRFKNPDDIEAALKYYQAAVDGTPPDHPNFVPHQRSLSVAYAHKYRVLGQISDLGNALHLDQMVLDQMSEDHPDYAKQLWSLAWSLTNLYEINKDQQVMETALLYDQKAVKATPDGHPDLPGRQKNLAVSFSYRYKELGDPKDLENALLMAQLSAQSETASPMTLWDTASTWANLAWEYGSNTCLEAYSVALSTLPSLLWIGNGITSRHQNLIRHHIPTITSSSVSAALHFNEPQMAVEFFEQGQSIIHKQSLQLKNDATELQKLHPVDAKKLQRISKMLQSASDESHTRPPINYNLLAQERIDLIKKIRTYENFESFLLPTSYPQLLKAAQEGPIIIINCSQWRTDAIIISSTFLYTLELPDASSESANLEIRKLKIALQAFNIHTRDQTRGAGPLKKADGLERTVKWLWESVVKPVFDTLSSSGIHGGRIWWCPSGPFTYLPIHAAAPQDSNYIQSYTPTLDVLIKARNKLQATSNPGLVTTVGMTNPPIHGHWSRLPWIHTELEMVTRAFSSEHINLIKDSQATKDQVLNSIKSSSWLHLACHAYQDPSDPLKSGFVLYDGILDLGQIMDIDLTLAKFVYLSACETAMGDANLANEAMHLTGGLLSAGFQGAIGTLWSMSDDDGPKVAEKVYRTLMGETQIPDVTLAAKGLHLAIQNLRNLGAPLHQWMTFIHAGL